MTLQLTWPAVKMSLQCLPEKNLYIVYGPHKLEDYFHLSEMAFSPGKLYGRIWVCFFVCLFVLGLGMAGTTMRKWVSAKKVMNVNNSVSITWEQQRLKLGKAEQKRNIMLLKGLRKCAWKSQNGHGQNQLPSVGCTGIYAVEKT